MGCQKESQIALQRIRGKDADISGEAAEIEEYLATLNSLPKENIQDLLQRGYLHPVIVGVGLMIFQQLGGINAIGFYASERL